MEFRISDLSMVAHELKTPINVISSTAQIVIKANNLEKLTKERIDEYMQSICHYCNKLELLTNNILDLSLDERKSINCDYETFNIEKFLKNFVKNLYPYADKLNFTIDYITKFNDCEFTCDYIKFERILLNLISNAVKYNNSSKKFVLIKAHDEKDVFVFSVKDNGVGIPKDMFEKILEPFYRIDSIETRKSNGCGLGLAIVKRFLNFLNGTLEIKSTVGIGSEFIIRLPKNHELSKKAQEPRLVYDSATSRIDIEMSNIM